jgi:hypothetical protein
MSGYESKYDYINSADDDETVYSNNRNKVVKAMVEMNDDDKLCFVRNVRSSDGRKKKTVLFGSGQINTTIRNAVTGARYHGHKIGSKNEDLYFKTAICTGEFGPDPVILFYDSSEQFEKHLGTNVESSIKEFVSMRQRTACLSNEERCKPNMTTLVK